jgi:hypothetical protein
MTRPCLLGDPAKADARPPRASAGATLRRELFATPRAGEFLDMRALQAQTGQPTAQVLGNCAYVVPTRTLYRVRRPTTAWPDCGGVSWAFGPGLQMVGPSGVREPGIGKAGASQERTGSSQECSPPQSRLEVGP